MRPDPTLLQHAYVTLRELNECLYGGWDERRETAFDAEERIFAQMRPLEALVIVDSMWSCYEGDLKPPVPY